ncbi:putative copper resistance protein D [Nonomuraea polychroma]|uniref:Putative copper resistance protein D n=2 Tax=Nonomuraea polychroma TaxID=46176 RepID=A0A438MA56_9ACTN|nr:putative copper resistance protein D [Nonomuraea polychroma]
MQWKTAYAGFAVGVGVVVLVAVLRFGGGAGAPAISGLPTAGPLTDWGLPLTRLLHVVCAVACVGTLLAAVLAPAGSAEPARCLRAAGWWALGWAFTTLLSYVLTLSSFIPMPVADLLAKPDELDLGTLLPQTQALLVVLGLTFVVAGATFVPRLPRWIPLAVAVSGLLPPAYVGHAASAADHDLAVSALMAHLVAASLWAGGLGAVLVHFRRSHDLPVVLPRFSTLALCCFVAVAFSGLAGAWVRLGAPSDLWRTPYGLLLLAKVAVLAVLGWFGRNHRRRTVMGIADRGVRRTFVRLAAGEVGVMAAAMGLAVGLSRTPPPAGGEGSGHGALGHDLAPFSPGALISEVRPDALIILLLALPAAAYLAGLRRVAAWPSGRTFAWYAGLALAALVLVCGVAGYARAMLSVQALQHVVLAVVVPLLLCAGAPVTLAGRTVTGFSRPAVLTVAYPAPFLLLYATGWLPWSLDEYAVHLATGLLFLGLGLAVSWVLAGADPLPGSLSWAARVRLLAVVAGTHLVLGTYLLAGPPVAADWLTLAAPPGAPDLLADQRLAGAVYLLVPLLALTPVAVRLGARARASQMASR